MQTQRVKIGDIEIACSEAGEGPPLVFVHGFTGHRDDFEPHLDALGRTSHVLAPDLRGHGDATHTGRTDTFTFETLVRDLEALLDALEIHACDLLGHSYGGMVVLRFVLAHPERVQSLILMDTAPFPPDGYTHEVFEKAGEIALARGMEFLQSLVEKAAKADPSPSPSACHTTKWEPHYTAHQRRRYKAMDPAAYASLGRSMLDQVHLTSRLGEIGCPTTVLVGADDTEFLRGADAFEAGIPGVHRVTIPDAGHHPQMENPGAWLEAIAAHLARSRRC